MGIGVFESVDDLTTGALVLGSHDMPANTAAWCVAAAGGTAPRGAAAGTADVGAADGEAAGRVGRPSPGSLPKAVFMLPKVVCIA